MSHNLKAPYLSFRYLLWFFHWCLVYLLQSEEFEMVWYRNRSNCNTFYFNFQTAHKAGFQEIVTCHNGLKLVSSCRDMRVGDVTPIVRFLYRFTAYEPVVISLRKNLIPLTFFVRVFDIVVAWTGHTIQIYPFLHSIMRYQNKILPLSLVDIIL